jgi:hypothetical protein
MTKKLKQLEFNFEEPDFKTGYKYLLHHIEELDEEIKCRENKTQDAITEFIEFRMDIGEDERTATREVYKRVYDDKWKNYIPGEYLTKEESHEWFDDNHDDWFCSGPYSDFLIEAEYETGVHDQYINGKIVKAYNHKLLEEGGRYENANR